MLQLFGIIDHFYFFWTALISAFTAFSGIIWIVHAVLLRVLLALC